MDECEKDGHTWQRVRLNDVDDVIECSRCGRQDRVVHNVRPGGVG